MAKVTDHLWSFEELYNKVIYYGLTLMWEYRAIKLEATGFWVQGHIDEAALESEMNRLGSQGWELVSCFDINRGGGGTRDVIAVFKRPNGE